MKVTANTLAELISYLEDLKTLVNSDSINKKLYKEGTTVGQVAFHAGQSASFYFRNYILNEDYKRNRDTEFSTDHTLEEILMSINNALGACKTIIDKDIHLIDSLQKTKTVYSRGFDVTTVFEVIQHVTAHTAEHFGEINNQ